MKQNHIDFITMGCSKNLVDTEALIARFEEEGWHCTSDPTRPEGEVAVVNTCGFIESAKEESVNAILEQVRRKKLGRLKKLYVMGCLSQRYRKDLEESIPEVDKFYGKFDFRQLLKDLGRPQMPQDGTIASRPHLFRAVTTPRHYAYLKIAEGCDRHCAYCAIPLITGPHHSRTEEDILQEAQQLAASGVKELQVIEQELTYYGRDLDGKCHIAELVGRLADIKGIEWIRLHYAYPNQFPMELLDVMRERENVCRYLDIALQHISDHMLSRMHRHVTRDDTLRLLDEIRRRVPGICIRTTLMVGFPGETDEDFQELLDFVRQQRFDRMGAFMYSEEEGTYSQLHYKDDVPEDVKQQRLDELMEVQRQISGELQEEKIGTTMRVIVDKREGDNYVARSEFSSPEVDPEVLIPAKERRLLTGHFYNVRITDANDYDLMGHVE